MTLQDQVALVTGSATGMGRATSLMLARQGAHVVVNYTRSEAEAKETAAAVEALGRKALLVRADVSDDRQVSAMVDETVKVFGRLDILVNNAGTTVFVPFKNLEELTEEIWDRVLAVNVKGTFFCSRAAAKVMLPQGSGCIVNVASTAGLHASGSSIAYAASKAAVISMTKTLAVALGPRIRVNAVAPGFVNTRWNAARQDMLSIVEEKAALKRYGEPEDVAEVIVALITSAGFVTGQVIPVDGGQFLA